MRHHCISTRVANTKRLTIPSVSIDVEQFMPSYIAGENENGTAIFENSLEVS